MKLLFPLLFAMTGIALAQDAAPTQSAQPKQIDPSDLPAMVQQILQTYKQVIAEAKPIFDAADVQLPKELLDGKTDLAISTLDKQAQSTLASSSATSSIQAETTDTSALKTGALQTGGLPLTLPNVDPTTEPIEQYQMWRKAERDKALRDRYVELKQIARQ